MHHGAFMQAIEFLIVHLPGVDERRCWRRKPFPAAPDGRRRASPARRDAEQFPRAFNRRSGYADTKAIQHIDRRALPGVGRQIRKSRVDGMGCELLGNCHWVQSEGGGGTRGTTLASFAADDDP
jgi:hypothetical protein